MIDDETIRGLVAACRGDILRPEVIERAAIVAAGAESAGDDLDVYR